MLLGRIFEPFVQQRPVAVLARGILERLLEPQALDRLFERTAERQYTHNLLFSTLVELFSQVVLQVQPSVHAAYQALADRIPVSDQAIYDKLRRVELAVSTALVEASAQRAAPLLRRLNANHPSWLRGFQVKILDGNHLAATEHRLAELRTTWAAPLPGKALVVLDQASQLITHVRLTEDGQAQERALLDDVLPLVQRRQLWIADRNFCTFKFLFGIAAAGAAFCIRQHGALTGELLGKRKAKGRCPTGALYEQKLRLRWAGRVLEVRRVTVVLDQPTTDGDTEIHVLTNLTVRQANTAQVAELYRKRWTIEGRFLEVTQTLACEINTLAYPPAALFAFCLALLASNAVAVLKSALRAVHGPAAVERLSAYYLTLELRRTYDGMMIAIPAKHWVVFQRLSDAQLARLLRQLAGHVNLARYRKHPRGPKKKPPRRSRYRNGEHVATAKLLAARKQRK
jgi:IS4 transposase